MTIEYSQLGPGYNDASLDYRGGVEAPVGGEAEVTIADRNRLSATSDEAHTATVTIE